MYIIFTWRCLHDQRTPENITTGDIIMSKINGSDVCHFSHHDNEPI